MSIYNKMVKALLIGLSTLAIIVFAVFVFNFDSNSSAMNFQPFSHLSPTEFNQAVASNKYKLIDVRTTEEYNVGHLKGASQSDYYQTQEFSNYLDKLNKKDRYLIYCRTGHRSGSALKIMQDKGFSYAYDLAGGYNSWISNGLPVEQ